MLEVAQLPFELLAMLTASGRGSRAEPCKPLVRGDPLHERALADLARSEHYDDTGIAQRLDDVGSNMAIEKARIHATSLPADIGQSTKSYAANPHILRVQIAETSASDPRNHKPRTPPRS